MEIWSRTRYDLMRIWWYDEWWYKDMEQWFIPCSHQKKGQLTFSSCSPWFKPPWKMDLMADFFLNWHYFIDLYGKKFQNSSLPCVKKTVLVWHEYNFKLYVFKGKRQSINLSCFHLSNKGNQQQKTWFLLNISSFIDWQWKRVNC